jgi:hypothetical protein
MTAKLQSRGECVFCGKDYTRGGMKKHLVSCKSRKAAIEKADAASKHHQPIYHLLVRDAYQGSPYWLHLEMAGTAALEDLDHYLRSIWLECCGHMSAFEIGKRAFRGTEISMENTAAKVFDDIKALIHIYDFGTTSETLIEVADERNGAPLTRYPIFLMARNEAPVYPCIECGKPAKYICLECTEEKGEPGFLCAKHAKNHPHDEYGDPLGVYNSPRTGMCAYDGPDIPPY